MELNLAREYRRGDRTFGPGRVTIDDPHLAARIARAAETAGDLLALEGEAAPEEAVAGPEIVPERQIVPAEGAETPVAPETVAVSPSPDPEPEVASAPPAVEAPKAEKPQRP